MSHGPVRGSVPDPAGKTEAWRQFAAELVGPRKSDFDASRKRLGIHERTFLQQTPMGDLVIVTHEGEDPASTFMRVAEGDDEFTRWFRSKVEEVHGVDLSAPPPGTLPELMIESGSA